MNIKNLRYWVFTSGEQGIHGLDWGIKHASEYFSDRQRLDTEYRALLRGFGLVPALERPADGVGLILLRWNESSYIAGFIFSGTDHGDRPNTSSVVCVIPSELVGRVSVNDLLKDIWERNDIAGIAKKNSRDRPDTLSLEGERVFTGSVPGFRDAVSWPSSYDGWLCVDGRQRKLLRKSAESSAEDEGVRESESKASSGWTLKIGLLMVAVIAAFFVVRGLPSNHETTTNNETTTTQAADSETKHDTTPVSKDIPPQKTIIAEEPANDSDDDALAKEAQRQKQLKAQRQEQIDELRDKLNRLLDGARVAVKEKSFIFHVEKLDEELYKSCEKLIASLQDRGTAKGITSNSRRKNIELALINPKSNDISECIEAFLNQNIKER